MTEEFQKNKEKAKELRKQLDEIQESLTNAVIIDGVDVAGWTDEEVYYKFEHHTSKAIKQIAFDLYRQLKRLEQENKELREMLSKEPKAMQAFQIAYSGLKKENEVLWGMVKNYKTALEEIKEYIRSFYGCEDSSNDYKLVNMIDKINEVLNA